MNMQETTSFIEVVAEATLDIIDSVNQVQVFGMGLFDMLLVLFVASFAVSLLSRFLFGGGAGDDRH